MKISQLLLPLLATGLLFSCASSDPSAEVTTEQEIAQPQTMQAVELGDMRKLHKFGDVFLGSQPSEADLSLLKELGVKSVINMRKAEEMQFDEAAVAEGLGLSYDHLGWNGPDELTDQVFDDFRTFMNKAAQPTLLHCASSNRVGAIWIAWRVLDQGASMEVAVAEAKMAGMRTPSYGPKAVDYVNRNSK